MQLEVGKWYTSTCGLVTRIVSKDEVINIFKSCTDKLYDADGFCISAGYFVDKLVAPWDAEEDPPTPIAYIKQMHKESKGKVDLSLIPTHAVAEMCRAYQGGIESGKYSRDNRSKIKEGDIPGLIAATLRHVFKYMEGEKNASDSGVHHMAHAMANLGMILEWDLHYVNKG